MKNQTLLQVFIGIFFAILAGIFTELDTTFFGIQAVKIYGLIGQLFLNALTLVVIPLVAVSIIIGTARMGKENAFGTLGVKTFGYFLLTSFFAAAIGSVCFNLFSPTLHVDQVASLLNGADSAQIAKIAGQSGDAFDKISQLLLRIVPSNILAAASQGQILSMILFCMIFGYYSGNIENEPGKVIHEFFKGLFQVIMKMTQLIMKTMPLGVFGLVAKMLTETGIDALMSQLLFVISVAAAALIFGLLFLPLMLLAIAKVNPLKHIRAVIPALFTAFSTCSTAATMPVTMACLEDKVGISRKLIDFIVPLGITANMAGTSLYASIATLFIAKCFGIELTIPTQIIVVLLAVVTSLGIAGIPSGCLFAIVASLQVLGIPSEALVLVMAVERIVDMMRALLNVFCNTCCAVLVAKSEGESLKEISLGNQVEELA